MDRRLFTIIKKELKRVFSDRRLVFTTIILPALSIYLMYSLMGGMLTDKIDDIDTNISSVAIINTPKSFDEFLNKENENRFDISYISGDIEDYKLKIIDGDLDLLIYFVEDFDKKVESFSTPNIERYYNQSEEYSVEAKYDMDNFFKEYENNLLGIRIGNLEHANVFNLNKYVIKDNLEDEKKATGKGLSLLFPMLIAIFLFAGAMSIGADIIAGEKERGTMATLLVTPVKRETLAMGKVISLAIIAIISASSSFIGILASLPSAGEMFARDGVDISALQFGFVEFLSLGAIMITLVGLYVSIISIVSILSNSVKEANTYMAPIYILVVMSGFSTMYSDGAVPIWRFLIPVHGSVMALKNLFAFELTSVMLLYTCSVSMIITMFLTFIIKMLFNSEKVMFGK